MWTLWQLRFLAHYGSWPTTAGGSKLRAQNLFEDQMQKSVINKKKESVWNVKVISN